VSAELLSIKEYAIAAGATLEIQRKGRFFQLMQASSSVAIVFKRNHSAIGNVDAVPEGFRWGPLAEENYFDAVEITSAAAQTVSIAISAVAEAQLQRIVGNITASLSKAATLDSLADDSIAATSTELVAAADSDRRAIMVTNLAANTDEVRVGDSGTGATNGVPVQPGETVTVETSAAIYVYNSKASAQSVALTVIKD